MYYANLTGENFRRQQRRQKRLFFFQLAILLIAAAVAIGAIRSLFQP